MGFRNPIVIADQIVSGAFSGNYTIDGLMVIGDPNAAHVAIGTDTHGADGVRLYGVDGITPIIDLNIGSPSIAGSVITGAVASATTATTAGSATNATNLSGGGTAAGSTAITGAMTVGNAAAAHVVIGSDAHGANGVRLYASDGVTSVIDLNIGSTSTFKGTIASGSTVPGSTVSGAVASATSASNVPASGVTAGTLPGAVVVPGGNVSGAVASATSATNATNLVGGGTAAGSTRITGALTVGTVGGANSWAVMGTDASGANGFRLYKAGATAIDLNITGTPTISGALIETAISGQRMALQVSGGAGFLFGYTGNATEFEPGYVSTQISTAPNGGTQGILAMSSPDTSISPHGVVATLDLASGSSTGTSGAGNGSSAVLSAGTVALAGGPLGVEAQWDGNTLTIPSGTDITAVDMHPKSARVVTSETTASTTFVGITTPVSVSGVIVPSSGKVKITHGAQMSSSTTTASCLATVVVVNNTTGITIVAASDDNSALGTNATQTSTRCFMLNDLVTLTPGHSLTVTQQYRVQGGGTGTFLRRTLVVEPCI